MYLLEALNLFATIEAFVHVACLPFACVVWLNAFAEMGDLVVRLDRRQVLVEVPSTFNYLQETPSARSCVTGKNYCVFIVNTE